MDEKSLYIGALLSPIDNRDYQAKDWVAMGVRPSSYEPPERLPVEHQGMVSSCVAESIATFVGYALYRETERSKHGGLLRRMSPMFTYHLRKHPLQTHGAGMYMRYALDDLRTYGVPEWKFFEGQPGAPGRRLEYPSPHINVLFNAESTRRAKDNVISTYFTCANDDLLADAIYQNGAGILVIKTWAGFDSIYDYALPDVPLGHPYTGLHAMAAIGYTSDGGIICQNSQGTGWGRRGYCLVKKNHNAIVERWGMTDKKHEWDEIELRLDSYIMYVNGEPHALDVSPRIINSRTMVPLRAVGEAIRAKVEWDESAYGVTYIRDGAVVKMLIDNRVMIVNDKPITLDVAPTIINNRTMVPFRAVGEAIGADVEWIDSDRKVIYRKRVD